MKQNNYFRKAAWDLFVITCEGILALVLIYHWLQLLAP